MYHLKRFFIGLLLLQPTTVFSNTAVNTIATDPITNGVWQKTCAVYGEDDYMTAQLVIQKNNWQMTYTAFEDKDCKIPYLDFTRTYDVIMLDGNKINFTALKVAYKPLSKETAEALKLAAWCGQTKWEKDTENDVTGLTCGDYQTERKSQITFSIFDSTSDLKKIKLGAAEMQYDGTSEAKRHQKLENQYYEKTY